MLNIYQPEANKMKINILDLVSLARSFSIILFSLLYIQQEIKKEEKEIEEGKKTNGGKLKMGTSQEEGKLAKAVLVRVAVSMILTPDLKYTKTSTALILLLDFILTALIHFDRDSSVFIQQMANLVCK